MSSNHIIEALDYALDVVGEINILMDVDYGIQCC